MAGGDGRTGRGTELLLIAFGIVLAAATSACEPPISGPPTLGPEEIVRQVDEWPPHPAAGAVIDLTVRGCIRDTGPAPIVASEDRGFGVSFVLFGDARNAGFCEVRRESNGSLVERGGGSGGAETGRGSAFVLAGLDLAPERSFLIGATPVGTAQVRAAVGSHAVAATLGGELFLLAWPNGTPAALVVALDAEGREIARLDSDTLAKLYARKCGPGHLGLCPP